MPANDLYKSEPRRGWLAAIGLPPTDPIGLVAPRTQWEMSMAQAQRTSAPHLPNEIRPKLGVCGRLIKLINPEG